MGNRKVLAVWGSPSSGKTTLSAKLSAFLSEEGYDVALLLCDTDAPPLPLLASPSDLEMEKSLGSIFVNAKVKM